MKKIKVIASFALVLIPTACATIRRNSMREDMQRNKCYQVSVDEGTRITIVQVATTPTEVRARGNMNAGVVPSPATPT
jgi:hypothetical protein